MLTLIKYEQNIAQRKNYNNLSEATKNQQNCLES